MRFTTDRGGAFINDVMDQLFCLLGAERHTVTAYRPTWMALVERFHSTLKTMIRALADSLATKQWDAHLQTLMFVYRTTPQEATGYTPFLLEHVREARLPIDILTKQTDPVLEPVETFRAGLLKVLRYSYEQAVDRQDRHQQDSEEPRTRRQTRITVYPIGSWVLLSTTRPSALSQEFKTSCWSGPYQVERRIGEGATYQVRRESAIDTVHVDRSWCRSIAWTRTAPQ